MGRTLEALRQGEAFRLSAREKPFFEDSLERDPHTDHPATEDAQVPFIEVGPNKKIEGSPQVMVVKVPAQAKIHPAHPTPAPPVSPAPLVESKAVSPSLRVQASLTPPSPLAVAFEPWPNMPRLFQGIAEEVITYHHPDHPVSQQYIGLADKIQEGLAPAQSHILLLAGSRSQVGTSTVLLNLAVAGARQGKFRVAVVDMHLKKPCLAQRLGYAGVGLQDVFQGKAALEQAVVQTGIANLHLVPAQASIPPVACTPDAVRWLFSWLRERFGLILVDAPPIDSGTDLPTLTSLCDCTFLVLSQNEPPALQRTLAQTLTAMGARLRGLLHTHSHT